MLYEKEDRFKSSHFLIVSEHVLSPLLLIGELLIDRIKLLPERWTFFVSILTIYMEFAIIYEKASEDTVYSLPNIDTLDCVPKSLQLIIIQFSCHYICCILSMIKEKYLMEQTVTENTAHAYETLLPGY